MEQRRKTQIVLDSKFRRFARYPNSWHYSLGLPEPVHNVVAVDLVRAIMPNTQQTVHAFNSFFQLTPAGGETVTVQVPAGNYEPPILLTAVGEALQAAGVAGASLTVDSATSLVTVSADEPFALPFGSGNKQETSLHRYLGFSNADTSVATSATGFYAMALPPPAYVTVSLAEVPRPGCRRAYRLQNDLPPGFNTRPGLQEELYTGLVTLDTDYQTSKFFTAPTADVLEQEFKPVDVRALTVDVKDDKGNPYDSNGFDHVLVLQLVTLEPPDLPLMCPGNNRVPGPSPWGAQCAGPFR